jgi:hypothetical protein
MIPFSDFANTAQHFEAAPLWQIQIEDDEFREGPGGGVELFDKLNSLFAIAEYENVGFDLMFIKRLFDKERIGRVVFHQQNGRAS